MKIAMVIPGRFHGFDLARALLARGHDVAVLTNYPRWATRRFGLPDESVHRLARHGVLARLAGRCGPRVGRQFEPVLCRMFGRWAARELARERWDVIHGWSGVSEEFLRAPAVRRGGTLLMRGSAHIVEQRRLLDDEARRVGQTIERPSDWMVAREQREYALADRILVLSSFARRTFLDYGVPDARLVVVPPGVDVTPFRPTTATIAARHARISGDGPLRALYVGALSMQKGLYDLAHALDTIDARQMTFTLVGPVLPEAAGLVSRMRGRARVVGKVPQAELPAYYADADVFVFPTIQDGFGVVLSQARAAGLPIVTTPSGGGTDVVTDGVDGWIVAAGDGPGLVRRLDMMAADRPGLARMAEAALAAAPAAGWDEAVSRLEAASASLLGSGSGREDA